MRNIRLNISKFGCACLFAYALFALDARADNYLCAKSVALKNGKVSVAKGLKQRTSACQRRETQIMLVSPQSTLDLVKSADGSGSGLDADTLDGIESSALATTAALDSVNSSVSALDTRLDTAESSIVTNSNSIATTQSDLAILDAQVSPGSNIIYVGSGAAYATLADAITYVGGQARSADSRWTIALSPGVHTVSSSTTLPTFTSIVGHGTLDSIIRGNISHSSAASAAVINLSTSSGLYHLTVENSSATVGTNATGVAVSALSTTDEDDLGSFQNVLDDVRVSVMGNAGTVHVGIYLSSANLLLKDASIRVGNADTANYGIFALGGSLRFALIDSNIIARDTAANTCVSNSCAAIFRQTSSRADITRSDLYGYTASLLANTGTTYVKDSYMRGNTTSIILSGTSALSMYNTTVSGTSAVSDSTSGTILCVASSMLTGTVLSSICG
jgi:hypothetical protein